MKPAKEAIPVSMDELEKLVERTRQAPLEEEGYRKLKAAIDTLGEVTELLADQDATIRQLRALLGLRSSEKTKEVLRNAGLEPESRPEVEPATERRPRPGHGRNGAGAFEAAKKVEVAHPELKRGDRCPACGKGKVYPQKEPKLLVRIVGQPPLEATVYAMDRLRCNLCEQVFTAPEPEGVGPEKYDETAGAMIAQLKYGSGMPFNRLEGLQQRLGIPLPASTQWEIAEEVAEVIKPAEQELIRQAAQGEVVHNDDTSMRVLHLERPPGDERTGVFTTGIVSVAEGRRVALFFTGREHAGENLAEVLAKRAAELGPPIQMCDALSRNVPKLAAGVDLLLANCLTHGRRRFVEVTPSFPAECRYVLEALGSVYQNDALAREQALSPEERLRFHQERSGPVMEKLHEWLTAELAEKRTEPNSGLGRAITYLLNHWRKLTLFLRQAGAPLDNNVCERALKKAVLHRKNALFYRTLNGAQVGDLFMTLIHTCELNGVNSFDYLVELQRHAAELAAKPSEWMPWNYRDTLARGGGLG